jgi:hypothetical protein
MNRPGRNPQLCIIVAASLSIVVAVASGQASSLIGREIAVPVHLRNGEEYEMSILRLIRYGEKLFAAKWTIQEGEGRPAVKGTASGPSLSVPENQLRFPHNFNRISGPDSNSCAGCHNEPYEGGGGDRATEVFVLGQRFDFATFGNSNFIPTAAAADESGRLVTLQEIANERKTIGMNGSGFIEMLARQMTENLQSIRDSLRPGETKALIAKGISFGALTRRQDGSWDTSRIQGLPAASMLTQDGAAPSLLILPFSQAGATVSLRDFTNNAFNQHFGMQSEERFGAGEDEDQDGVINELTTADITAVTLYQATLSVPGQVIPTDPVVRLAIRTGKQKFQQVGCASCHVPKLPLIGKGWVYTEPGPFNPANDLRPSETRSISVDLTSDQLPAPRLKSDVDGIVWVPVFTDLKLHNITNGPNDPNAEFLDQNQPAGSDGFFAGNQKFITRKLWGVGNSGPYMHHGKFTTMREAIQAHAGEALQSRQSFQRLSPYERDCIIEFLKSLQILPPGTRSLAIDENGRPTSPTAF